MGEEDRRSDTVSKPMAATATATAASGVGRDQPDVPPSISPNTSEPRPMTDRPRPRASMGGFDAGRWALRARVPASAARAIGGLTSSTSRHPPAATRAPPSTGPGHQASAADGRPRADGAGPSGRIGVQRGQQGQGGRDQSGRRHAEQGTPGDERAHVGCGGTQRRDHREPGQRSPVDVPGAPPVGECSGSHQQAGEDHRVGVDGPWQRRR